MKLATIPETLSRNLKKLKVQKLISLKDNRVTVLNKEGLRKLAEDLESSPENASPKPLRKINNEFTFPPA